MGRFIGVEIDSTRLSSDEAERVARSCPVDIFALDAGGRLVAVPENEDECILCGRCVEIAPGAVEVRRLYGDGREVTAGGGRS